MVIVTILIKLLVTVKIMIKLNNMQECFFSLRMSNSTKRLMRNQRVDRVLEGQYMKKKGAKAAKRAATL